MFVVFGPDTCSGAGRDRRADGSLPWALGSDALCRPSQNAVPAHVPVRLALAPVAPARAVPQAGARVPLEPAAAVHPQALDPIVTSGPVALGVRHATVRRSAARDVTRARIARRAVRARPVRAGRQQVHGVRRGEIDSRPAGAAIALVDRIVGHGPTVRAARSAVRALADRSRVAIASTTPSGRSVRHAANGPTGATAPRARVVQVGSVPAQGVRRAAASTVPIVPIVRHVPAVIVPTGTIAVIESTAATVPNGRPGAAARVARPAVPRGRERAAVLGVRCVRVGMHRGPPDRVVN